MNISDFRDDNDEALVIVEQPRTEVFFNQNETLTIYQRGCNDGLVTVSPLAIPELIRHLQVKWRDYCEAHDLPLVPDALASLPPLPMPMTSPKKKRGPP